MLRVLFAISCTLTQALVAPTARAAPRRAVTFASAVDSGAGPQSRSLLEKRQRQREGSGRFPGSDVYSGRVIAAGLFSLVSMSVLVSDAPPTSPAVAQTRQARRAAKVEALLAENKKLEFKGGKVIEEYAALPEVDKEEAEALGLATGLFVLPAIGAGGAFAAVQSYKRSNGRAL